VEWGSDQGMPLFWVVKALCWEPVRAAASRRDVLLWASKALCWEPTSQQDALLGAGETYCYEPTDALLG
jgi:hypothetical protein